jgi:hypothetical protein
MKDETKQELEYLSCDEAESEINTTQPKRKGRPSKLRNIEDDKLRDLPNESENGENICNTELVEDVSEDEVVSLENLEFKYRLNVRGPTGLVRGELSKSVLFSANDKWPDLMKIIPSDRWVTSDEIITLLERYHLKIKKNNAKVRVEDVPNGLEYLESSGILLKML